MLTMCPTCSGKLSDADTGVCPHCRSRFKEELRRPSGIAKTAKPAKRDDSRHTGLSPVSDSLAAIIEDPEIALETPVQSPDTSATGNLGLFGHFEVLSFLAKGGMGAVFQARDIRNGRLTAIKIPSEKRLAEPCELARLRREARLAQRLDHPNICRLHEFGQIGKRYYLSLEFIDGLPLRKWVCQARPTLNDVATLVAHLARAVHYAHGQGVIHRDIKPDNIMVRAGGCSPVLLDFGLAREPADDVQLTKVGICVGTPAYMSPEQAFESSEPTAAADVYSLGAVLYELLTGRPPYMGQPIEVLMALRDGPAEKPRVHNPDISVELDRVVRKAMRRDATRRFAGAAAFADALEAAIAASTDSAFEVPESSIMPPSPTARAPECSDGSTCAGVLTLDSSPRPELPVRSSKPVGKPGSKPSAQSDPHASDTSVPTAALELGSTPFALAAPDTRASKKSNAPCTQTDSSTDKRKAFAQLARAGLDKPVRYDEAEMSDTVAALPALPVTSPAWVRALVVAAALAVLGGGLWLVFSLLTEAAG